MPKAYWIAHIDVHDPETYKLYLAQSKLAFDRYGAKFLARGGRSEVLDGTARARNVLIEFASMDEALACFRSEEYTKAMAYRTKASTADVVLIEGV